MAGESWEMGGLDGEVLGKGLPLVAGSFVAAWGWQEKPPPPPPLRRHGIRALQDLMRFSWQPAFLPAPQPLRVIAALSRSGGVKTRDYTVSVVPF